jgi:hypothetical protein
MEGGRFHPLTVNGDAVEQVRGFCTTNIFSYAFEIKLHSLLRRNVPSPAGLRVQSAEDRVQRTERRRSAGE